MALITTPGQLKRSAEFYRELASLLGAGVPILQALRTILRQPPSASYRRPLNRAMSEINEGATLAEALAQPRGWLPAFDLALLSAGEQSGRLVESCRSLAEHYAERASLADATLTKLLYPVFIFHLAILVFPPDLLPELVLKGRVEAFVLQKLSILLPCYGFVLISLFAFQSRRAQWWRSFLEQCLRLVPLLGTARQHQALARLAAALEALVSAGVGIIEAWGLASEASASPAIKRVVRRWQPRIQSGELPSDLVSRSSLFPELFANLYHTGEISGQLDQELRHLYEYYRESGSRKMGQFMLGATLLVSLGVMLAIGFYIIRFWMNYYNNLFNAF